MNRESLRSLVPCAVVWCLSWGLASCAPASGTAAGSASGAAEASSVATSASAATSSQSASDTSAAAGTTSAQASSEATSASASSASQTVLLSELDATVYTEQGEPVRLTSIAQGKPLLINVWATWCPYCIEEMPDLQAICREYEGRVAFAFVDAGDGEPDMAARDSAWLREQGFELPAYYDEKREATQSLGAWSLPTTILVTADGQVVAAAPGKVDPTRLRAALDQLVASASPA